MGGEGGSCVVIIIVPTHLQKKPKLRVLHSSDTCIG